MRSETAVEGAAARGRSLTLVSAARRSHDPCGLKAYLHATGMAHLCHAAGFDDGGIATIVASWFGRGVVMEERVGERVGSVKRGRQKNTTNSKTHYIYIIYIYIFSIS